MTEDIFHTVYEAVLTRSERYDGIYYTGIVSTKIFCRPSCRSRIPKPENVRIYSDIEAARQAGFRPCKRCKPEISETYGPDRRLVQNVTEVIRTRYDEPITLQLLGTALHTSPYHLQRVYKQLTGITPAQMLLQTRMNTAKRLLVETTLSIAEVAFKVGFRSPSYFSSTFQTYTGITPSTYKQQKEIIDEI
ncbi:helix-turn-helix domain-containing protein [Ectobacillus sp. JY-23]|uniref:bifunctional transcriptional activator/DNA repair enzyme AdaA n=1 Tax=Ectobacillus sp. JY-23 TaxID=2933872 RepID=UPI001FF29CD4|nr:Ada metal-binding domain-containing protein [Ectobacillus sp. JY-23]UOY93140.1 helix-turn-helix domain-containing protein [Ectobacillus sp. JY-23]